MALETLRKRGQPGPAWQHNTKTMRFPHTHLLISCFLRLSTTCSWCQRWRKPRSSKFVWSTGTTWQQNSTEKVRSPRPRLLCCPGTSTSTFRRGGSSICQCSPRCCQRYQPYQLYWCHIIPNESIMCLLTVCELQGRSCCTSLNLLAEESVCSSHRDGVFSCTVAENKQLQSTNM